MVKKTMSHRISRSTTWVVLLLFVFFSSVKPCSSFNIGEEREVGEKLLYSIRTYFPVLDDPDLTQYISSLGSDVLKVAGIQYFDYRFFIVQSKDFNAFAAPSGLIFFYTGLIAAMNSEDELVSVLAHEIGHIVKRHLAQRAEKSKYSTAASLGLALAAIAFGGAATPALLTGAMATGQSMDLHFSRQHEEEADMLAYSWMTQLERDPEGQAKMLESMRRIARYRSDQLPQYLLTHPNPEERLNTIQALMYSERDRIEKLKGKTDDFAFLRFKYRIMSIVQQSRSFRAYLANQLSRSGASDVNKTMAKYGMSQIERKENNYQRSLEYLEAVIEQYPDRPVLLVDKGIVEFAAGMVSEAELTLRRALREDRSDLYGVFTLAQLLSRTGRDDEAEPYFKEVMYGLPEYPSVYFELGQIASKRGQSGASNFYLGKSNLYSGKLKLALYNFRMAGKDSSLSADMKEESKILMKKIKKLEK